MRINGDGSIRLVYDGTSLHANGEASEDRDIGKTTFTAYNGQENDNAFVGYMYGTKESSTYAETHANKNDSTIKKYIDNWYEQNILGNNSLDITRYLSDNTFCNDRSFSSYNTGTGIGISETRYRWWAEETDKMSLTCPNQHDAFTVNDTLHGNGDLKYPIGLLTADEFILAGGDVSNGNTSFYLYTGNNEWLLSVHSFTSSYSRMRIYDANGKMESGWNQYERGAKIVLNLKSDSIFSGTGTIDNPYIVGE